MTKTNETRCILASSCSFAGSDAKCHDRCPAYIQMHSASGRHTLARLPADYALTRLETAPPRADQPEAYGIIDGYAATFERQFGGGNSEAGRIKSLYLYSAEPGTGKTTSAAALLNEYLRVHYVGSVKRGVQPAKNPAMWLDINHFQTLYNRANRGGSPESVRQPASVEYFALMDRATKADFAVLDDIGVRGASEAFRSDLHDIINSRMMAQKATVYTSNMPIYYRGAKDKTQMPYDMEDVYDARLADRINEQCFEVAFKGRSKRGLRK